MMKGDQPGLVSETQGSGSKERIGREATLDGNCTAWGISTRWRALPLSYMLRRLSYDASSSKAGLWTPIRAEREL